MLTALVLGVLLPNVEMGQSPTTPAQVAGPWEALVAPSEVAGFSLQIITNPSKTVRFLRIDTYVRKDGTTTRTWWSSGSDGAFVLRTGLLSFHQVASKDSPFDVALDMTYDPDEISWKGTFRNPYFSGRVVLRRPSFTSSSALTGTWRTYSAVSIDQSGGRRNDYGCDNIGLGQDGALVLWSEFHNIFLGTPTEQVYGDLFGELYNDSHAQRSGSTWTFTADNGMSGDDVTGTLSTDGSSFTGFGKHFGNGFADSNPLGHPLAWTRMPNFSCQPLVTR